MYEKIASKALAGQAISQQEALFLWHKVDLIRLMSLAGQINDRRNSDRVYFNLNQHINPTNVCVLSCKFCSFARKPGDAGAFALSHQQIQQRAEQAWAQGATEVHLVGGLHPRWRYQDLLDIVAVINDRTPELHIKAYTAVEIDWLAKKGRKTIEGVLNDLKDAGLGSLPGGGAEIFHPQVRQQICGAKIDAERWLDIHRCAHRLGLRSNATMLYGHIETPEHRIDHMVRLRQLQDESGGFNVFIPLAFQPLGNDMGIDRYTAGADDLRTIAIARIFLNNFPNIKAYWVMLGREIAQLALVSGANDLDGTVEDEKISQMAGGQAGRGLATSELVNLITSADRQPVERDSLYRIRSTVFQGTTKTGLLELANETDVTTNKQEISYFSEPHSDLPIITVENDGNVVIDNSELRNASYVKLRASPTTTLVSYLKASIECQKVIDGQLVTELDDLPVHNRNDFASTLKILPLLPYWSMTHFGYLPANKRKVVDNELRGCQFKLRELDSRPNVDC